MDRFQVSSHTKKSASSDHHAMTIHCHVAAPMTHLQVVQKGVHGPLFAIPELLKRRQLFLVVAMLAQRGRCAR